LTIWWEVEDALEEIINDYEKVNHVISIFQDDKTRLLGLRKMEYQKGVSVELGSGPGNFSRMIENYVEGSLICLDFSAEMLQVSRKQNSDLQHCYIRSVFEALPFRKKSINFVTAAYAIRDSLDKRKAFSEIYYSLKNGGKLLLIDIGKPNNWILRGFMGLYMRFLVPILGGLIAGYGFQNPWSVLWKTFDLLPRNRDLCNMMKDIFGNVSFSERAFDSMIIALAMRR
jgi:demethylmenaquinone methyltransferase/2-methoxy-6-polyprenyl-1,4-benzoquinol methylase